MKRYKPKVISYHGLEPTFGFTIPNEIYMFIDKTKFTPVMSGPHVLYLSGPDVVTKEEAEAYTYGK